MSHRTKNPRPSQYSEECYLVVERLPGPRVSTRKVDKESRKARVLAYKEQIAVGQRIFEYGEYDYERFGEDTPFAPEVDE